MCEEDFNNLKNLLWNENVPWVVKVLCGTYKEPLFLYERVIKVMNNHMGHFIKTIRPIDLI